MEQKRILYIGTPIFNFHKHIINEFQKLGYTIDYYNDRPSENSFIKGIYKIKKKYMAKVIQAYLQKILEETSQKKYDMVFIINGKTISPEMMESLRLNHPESEFVYYIWDSLKLYPESEAILPHFDRAYTFDLEDHEKVQILEFMPLFYSEGFEEINKLNKIEKYDLISVCTVHPNRYELMSSLFPYLEEKGIKIFSYMFLNPLQYFYNKLFIPEFKTSSIKQFKFSPLTEKENIEYLSESKVVFDVPHSKQTGLTMRTIETLGSKKKLITTNESIKKYDFYNENNIFVLNDENRDDISEFIQTEYVDIDKKIYQKYSVVNWVKRIVHDENEEYIKEG